MSNLEFDLPKDQSSIIKVIGVGGGGSNAVNHMYNQGIKGVDFIVCNTDAQALDASPVPIKIQLGASLTEGRGAGSIPEIGKNAAVENIDDVKDILSKNTKMVFITAGMGGGTGTGAGPVIAKIAKEMGILTVAIVTVPFTFEGRKRRIQAEEGLDNLRSEVDTILVINNDRLRDMFGNLTLGNAFEQADNVLTSAAKGIAEVISVTGAINVDFNDVNTVMRDSGVAIMGSAVAEGENRAHEAVSKALSSPLLNDNDIEGAKYVLLNITYGEKEILMDEIAEITDYIQDEAGSSADVIWGHGKDETLGEGICVTLIATGFQSSPITGFERAPEKKKMVLEEEPKKEESIPQSANQWSETSTEVENSVEEEMESEPFLKTKDETEAKEDKSSMEQGSFNWNLTSNENASESTEEQEEVTRYYLEDDETEEDSPSLSVQQPKTVLSQEEQQAKSQERLNNIRNYTDKLKSADGVDSLESEPAYLRKNVNLDDVPHSSENNISRFTLGENDEGDSTGLKSNNSFLHDNVD
ncbi:MAG: cell division protein FtsZ [Crocinitomicaceae bacterium]|nr:cell division protein FtsZ [Crocinitomicaceae bacterium]